MTAIQSRASKEKNATKRALGVSREVYVVVPEFGSIWQCQKHKTLSSCLKEQHKGLGHWWTQVGAARGCTHREGAAHPQPEEHSALKNQPRAFSQQWMLFI